MGKIRALVLEFKGFVLRGNILDLAVAVAIATAFTAMVTSFTADVLMAFVAAVFGQPDFASVTIEVGDGAIAVGRFLNAVVGFVAVAAALFAVLKMASLFKPERKEPIAEAPAPSDEVVLLGEIRDLLRTGPPRDG